MYCIPSVSCFLKGTQILTSKGEKFVEDIVVGDVLVTVDGDCKPAKWVGRQQFKKSTDADWQDSILPVRISRFALDDRTPHRDLYVSPGHGILIDGVLIAAHYLANGTSIVRAMPEATETIEYFHIELETHEVIYAEGAAAETFLVKGDREMFDNFVEYERLYGVKNRLRMEPYAPYAYYNGGYSELKAILRLAIYPIIDIRDPLQVATGRIAKRAARCANVR